MVGYTALVQSDESQAMEVLERHNRLLRPFFPKYHGKEVKAIGDSFLVEFDSALDATKCAVELQSFLHDYNVSSKNEWRITLRIGIHLGDVIHRGGDVFGDAVNIASRIEPIAKPEGICVSEQVYDQVRNKVPFHFVKLEPQKLKSVNVQIDVYSVSSVSEVKEGPQAEFMTNRIAVLPFRSMSPDPNDEYFAEGMTEEIISAISRVSQLSVISRTSVMGYKSKDKSASEIGRELRVGTLIEGSVRKAGNRVRITAQLIDTEGDRHLWVENYDRNMEDVFAIQSEIAEKVASSLKVKLLEEDRRKIERGSTSNVEAYTLYLKGRIQLDRWDRSSLSAAISYCDRATALDPNYASAYAALSMAHSKLGFQDLVEPKEAYRKAEEYARKALELDESNPEAHAALGMASLSRYDFVGRERELRRAIELKPSFAEAHAVLAATFAFLARWDECISEVEKSLELDPLSVNTSGQAGTWYLYAGQFDKAVRHLKDALELDPQNSFYLDNLGLAYVQKGMVEEGLSMAKRAAEMSGTPEADADLAFAYVKAGKQQEARKVLANLLEPGEGRLVSPTAVAGAYATLGEKQKALDLLERAYEEGSGYLPSIGVDFVFENLRDEPRFKMLLGKMGLNSQGN